MMMRYNELFKENEKLRYENVELRRMRAQERTHVRRVEEENETLRRENVELQERLDDKQKIIDRLFVANAKCLEIADALEKERRDENHEKLAAAQAVRAAQNQSMPADDVAWSAAPTDAVPDPDATNIVWRDEDQKDTEEMFYIITEGAPETRFYATAKGAHKEAVRLAQKCSGVPFYVLRYFGHARVETRTCWWWAGEEDSQ